MGHILSYKGSQVPSGIVNDSSLVLYLDAGLAQSYPGTGTTWTDLTEPKENGTLINGVGYSSANQGSLVFDGVNDYVNVLTALPFSLTASVWAKSTPSTWNENGFLVSVRKANGFVIHPVSGTNNVIFYINDSSGSLNSIGTAVTIPNIQNWNYYTILTNGSNSHSIYINGVHIFTSSSTIPRTSSVTKWNLKIGNDDTTSRYLNGNISEVELYNRALTPTEITQNFNALKGRYGL